MTHKRETCRLCGTRTRRLFSHVFFDHIHDTEPGDFATAITALMRRARGDA